MRHGRPTSDPALVRLVQEGSPAALEALYQRYRPSVWRYVYTHVSGNQATAEDVVSEVFLSAIRGLEKLDPDGGSLYAWLMGIARHKLADHWRTMGRAREQLEMTSLDQTHCRRTDDPHGLLETHENRMQVVKIMAELPDEERLILEWKYLDDLSVRDIANRICRTEKAVEAMLYRARKSFRTIFQGL